MRQAGIRNARRVARTYVTRLGVTAPGHIRIEAIAKRIASMKRLALRIVDAPLEGADSQLIRVPGEIVIIVSTRIKDRASRRFVIAHELAHFVLEHPSLPPHTIGEAGPSRRTPDDVRDYEAEANAFASELTMPYKLVRDLCRVAPVTLSVPQQISRSFGMSILASAIRVAELSQERCAAVFSSNRRVIWSAESATFGSRIERDRSIDARSVAHSFWERGSLPKDASEIPAQAWLDACEGAALIEHAIASHEHKTVLSMLWIPPRMTNAATRETP
jgi:hypothetical protein